MQIGRISYQNRFEKGDVFMSVNIYDVPQGEKISKDFSLLVNGQAVPVHEAHVSAVPFNRRWPGNQRPFEQSELAYFAAFETDESVEIKITPEKPFHNVVIRPLSKNITPQFDGNTITFTLSSTGGYSVELDGFHHALHIFFDPIKNYDVDLNSKNTIYFGPGMHDAGMLHLQSNQTVFVDAGAIVYASIHVENAENIRILGRGIIDNSKNREEILFEVDHFGDGAFDVGNSRRENTIQLKYCKNIQIDGITIRDSLVYNLTTWGCEDLLVDNVKIIGSWRYNSDGIDMHNSSRCVVKNCFVRTYDDSICVKGHEGYPQICEDIVVENCVVWCDWDHALEIGAETCAEHIRNIIFRNCDVIRSTHVALDVLNVDYGDVHDVLFDDIRVEYDPISQCPQIQKSNEDEFLTDPNSDYMSLLFVSKVEKHEEYSQGREMRGKNHDIVFSNIRVFSDKMPPSFFVGYDSEHKSSDIKISNLFLNGERRKTLDEANITKGDFVENITIE
jgi:hypothetical protein